MEKIKILHNDLIDSSAVEEKRLSVVVSTDGLYSFMQNQQLPKYRITSEKCSNNHDVTASIRKLLDDQNMASINVFYDTGAFTLMPRSMFLYGEEKTYCRNVFPISKTDVFFADQLQSISAVNIYGYSLVTDLNLRQEFPGIGTSHILSSIIEKQGLVANNSMFVYLMQNHFYIVLKDAVNLVLASRFELSENADLLYHISKIVEEQNYFGPIVLAGFISKDDFIKQELATYHSDVQLYSDEFSINASCILN